jgi:3-oxoacyl-[acyl-carrier protein] reductase
MTAGPDAAPVMLITGTRKGIGHHLARRYAAQGFTVYGCSRGELAESIPRYTHFCVDITDEDGVRNMLREIRTRSQRLDVLINNAGIASMNAMLLTPLATARHIVETNFLGTFLCCREAARLMQRRKSGRIVNLTTVAVPLKLEGEAVYAASKAAVVTLTEILARELASFAITVNAVGPTPIHTDLIRNVPRETLDRLLQRQAIRRFAEFEDVANVIDFFISDRSGMVTGQTVYLGGV